ncbi:hypothetical protein ACQ4PT_021529 [Festuca glaucescens]
MHTEDGNWDDGQEIEELGFQQGSASQIGGIVDMEDDVYPEFDEEEEKVPTQSDPNTWKLLAWRGTEPASNQVRGQCSKHFTEDVWQLRNGIRYSERGKNYYMITLFSRGDYDFVMRGGPWIFKRNALLIKDFDESAQPYEIVLDSAPIWVRIYDVPWGKQDEVWGKRYGSGLGEALEVDVPSADQDKNEFLLVRVNLPYDRRLQTQITTRVKGKRGRRAAGSQRSSSPHAGSRVESDEDEMPPLEDDIAPPHETSLEQVGTCDGFEEEEKKALGEIERNLAARVDAMQVDPSTEVEICDRAERGVASQPIIQFPDEEQQPDVVSDAAQVKYVVAPNLLAHMQQMGASRWDQGAAAGSVDLQLAI